jgi:hypothetical protein
MYESDTPQAAAIPWRQVRFLTRSSTDAIRHGIVIDHPRIAMVSRRIVRGPHEWVLITRAVSRSLRGPRRDRLLDGLERSQRDDWHIAGSVFI